MGSGLAIYAIPNAATAAPSGSQGSSSNGDPSHLIYFRLVPVVAQANGHNASGYAGLSVSGGSVTVEWSISGASPGAVLAMEMLATASGGTSQTFNLDTSQVSEHGTAGGTSTVNLDQGNYTVGLKVVDSSRGGSLAFVSDPATAQVTIGAYQAPPPSLAIGNTVSFALVPLPVYLHQDTPANFPFREGGALVVISGETLEVTTSFVGASSTAYTTVLQTSNANITVGTVTTGSSGGGVYKGNVTLRSGTYEIGLLIFVAGKTDSPVAVSMPRDVRVTVGQPNESTSSTESYSSSTTAESSEETTSSSSSSTSSQGPHGVTLITFVPITTASHPGYSFGQGKGGYVVTDGKIYFSLAFTGQNPDTHFSLSLSVNGTARTIGDYTTTSEGNGNLGASTMLGSGAFALTLTVVDTSTFDQPTPVLTSVPASFTVVAHSTSTTSTTSSTTATTSTSSSYGGNPNGHAWTFKLVPATVENAPNGYKFADSGTAVIRLDAHYSLLNVEVGFQDANPSTTYTAALVLNGTTDNLGTMTTNHGGAALLHSSVQINPGTYLIGVVVYDVSDIAEFNAQGPVPVMVSSPTTELIVIHAPNEESYSTSSSTSSSASSAPSSSLILPITKTATTIPAGSEVQSQIQNAVANLTIPATVQVTPLSSSTSVLDSRFSVSVGQQVGNGLVVAISGENVTGPRTLLINMSRTSPLALYPALNITLDGMPVAEASSALQVLNPSPTNPPYYVLIGTSDSVQLLVSIPHFSLHLIQVAGVIVHTIVSSLELDAPLLLGSIIVVTLAFAAAYAARKRYFSILL